MGPDTAELMNDGEPPEDGPVLNLDVTGKGRGVCHDHIVPNSAIVGYVRVGHEEIAAADAGFPCLLQGSPVQGRVLANHIDLEQRGVALRPCQPQHVGHL
jgi:hypothetical protein